MFEAEDTHFWYRGLRRYLRDALARHAFPAGAAVLDAGCGSGGNLALLERRIPLAFGVDLSPEAIALSRQRGLTRTLVADMQRLPFADGAFDGVFCSDVFECAEVDPSRGMAELARVTRRGGRIVVTVAAFQFLLSEHDRAVHSVRRFTRARARRAFAVNGVRIVAMRYLFGALFVPIVGYRLLRGLARAVPRGRATAPPRSDVFLPPRLVNAALDGVVRLETALARRLPLPFGTTLLVELARV